MVRLCKTLVLLRLWGIFYIYSMGTVASEHFKPMPHTAEEVVMEIFRFDGDGLVGESHANALAARRQKHFESIGNAMKCHEIARKFTKSFQKPKKKAAKHQKKTEK